MEWNRMKPLLSCNVYMCDVFKGSLRAICMCIPFVFKKSAFGKRKNLTAMFGSLGGKESKIGRNLTPYLSDLVETGK